MMDYQTAIRGAFFDIAQVCDSAEAIPATPATLTMGCCLFTTAKFWRR
jgi:guanine deaminase